VLRAVISVASTAMRPLWLAAAAGLTPGSTPTTAMAGWRWRRAVMAAAVAVLQATTISRQPWATSSSPMASTRPWTKASDLEP